MGGSISPQLYCHAHSLGVRVVRGIDFPPADQWDNETVISTYISDHIGNMKSCHTDGFNLDVEVVDTPAQSKSMVALARRFTAAMHAVVPGSQVSFDVDSLAAPCSGNPTKPDYIYDVVGLAKAVDFLVVMEYDSANNPEQKPFFKGPMALPLLKVSVEKYAQLGVPPSSLVLAMPWYGYEWVVEASCSGNGTCPGAKEHHYVGVGATGPNGKYPAGPSFTCHDGVYKTPGSFFFNLTCPSAYGLLPHASHGEEWDAWSQTPFLRYTDPHQGTAYEIWYENQESLALKYAYAKKAGVRGVGMWQANSINYQNKSQVDGIWGSLRSFTGAGNYSIRSMKTDDVTTKSRLVKLKLDDALAKSAAITTPVIDMETTMGTIVAMKTDDQALAENSSTPLLLFTSTADLHDSWGLIQNYDNTVQPAPHELGEFSHLPGRRSHFLRAPVYFTC
jgi:di-N-acetylchitobiase